MNRSAKVKRKTKETDISLEIELMSLRDSKIDSGVPFFDHMLSSMSRHGRFYLDLRCNGDYEIDDHHSVEDMGICLGRAFREALGDKAGITRFGDVAIPMDDALVMVAVDLSGRSFFKYSGMELSGNISKFSEELTMEFLRAFTSNAEINLHVNVIHGENRHHIHEAIYKALGVALYKASSMDAFLEGNILSTKGTIV